MPKSQQVLVGICLILFIFDLIAPVIGTVMHIELLGFSSPLIKGTQLAFVIFFGVFTYRQIKRKGFK
ncbi:hypothetical protein ACWEX2_05320 [Staphylococcus xylosus]|uniref:Uncharacterized protein n=1 Tax=Staphylococcus xylosus TaxID=1288 RepID=A0AAQ0RXY8_STAXY|nr:hypothetical protein [Staphylococcus xylosus]MCM3518325.1 hypothetical protein [Staphylococcus xylosus]PTH98316.1 hypothetical protein BU099_08480 [Staphylococcus xylosus]RIM64823.1 hypothetical protein BU122_09340 [Staphylococcus xylosus]RIM93093.1 hypothetical protein BU104_06610 [Staphylococcus xylosus]